MSAAELDTHALVDRLRPTPGAPLHSQVEDRLRQLIRNVRTTIDFIVRTVSKYDRLGGTVRKEA